MFYDLKIYILLNNFHFHCASQMEMNQQSRCIWARLCDSDDVFDELPLIIHLIVTEETLVEFANAVMCSKVSGHTTSSNLLITMLAFVSWRSAIWIH